MDIGPDIIFEHAEFRGIISPFFVYSYFACEWVPSGNVSVLVGVDV